MIHRYYKTTTYVLLIAFILMTSGCSNSDLSVQRVNRNKFLIKRPDGIEQEVTIQDKALAKMSQDDIYEFLHDVDPSEHNVILYDIDYTVQSPGNEIRTDFSDARFVNDCEDDTLSDLEIKDD